MALGSQYEDLTRQVQNQLKGFPRPTWRSVLRAPFTLRTCLDSVYNLLAFPLGVLWFAVFLVLLVLGVGLIPMALAGLVVLFITFVAAQAATTFERMLTNLLLGSSVEPPARRAPASRRSPLSQFWARLVDPATWKELIYLFLRFPLGTASFLLTVAVWGTAVSGIASPLFWRSVRNEPGGGANLWVQGTDPPLYAHFANLATGIVALLLAPWIMRAFAVVYTGMAQVLLGRSHEQELEHEVERLAGSRDRSVAATTNERARIERDLHDGAQARLVSLAVDLGRARERLTAEAPDDDATAMVVEAHEQAKLALTELRDLARGIHPAVLTDRGLDAALSSLAARSPVPATLDVDLPARPSPRVEVVAYFVLSELLANVAQHSRASEVRVSVALRGDRLQLEVVDDGEGGADPAKGSGLAGLRDRVEAIDGTIDVVSPVGGPTAARADLPFT